MRRALLLVAGVGIAVPALIAQAQHRELGPHQHGHGTLNIAIEGGRVSMPEIRSTISLGSSMRSRAADASEAPALCGYETAVQRMLAPSSPICMAV